MSRIDVLYRVTADAASIEARATAIAVEQSVEMPVSAIDDPYVLSSVVGRVDDIRDCRGGRYEVRIALAVATTGLEAGQLMNMLFGNASLLDGVELIDARFPDEVLRAFGGPRAGLAGLRARVGAARRALTASALKPQGLSPDRLASVARSFALGGLDYLKDDHGLADQAYSPYADRLAACARAVRDAARETGHPTQYVPSVTGTLDALRQRIRLALDEGLSMVLIAPMIVGLPAFHAVVRDFPAMTFMAHPAMAGAAKIAPPLLLGRLFRLLGADATVFPNYGGRFGYSPETCRGLADAARAAWGGLRDTTPVPAGGMTTDRVGEMLDFYGPDVMLLIGGGLLSAGARLTDETLAFTRRVAARGPSPGKGAAS